MNYEEYPSTEYIAASDVHGEATRLAEARADRYEKILKKIKEATRPLKNVQRDASSRYCHGLARAALEGKVV